MVRRLRDRVGRAGRAGKVGRATRCGQYWKILSIHPPLSIMHRFKRFLYRWIAQSELHNFTDFQY